MGNPMEGFGTGAGSQEQNVADLNLRLKKIRADIAKLPEGSDLLNGLVAEEEDILSQLADYSE